MNLCRKERTELNADPPRGDVAFFNSKQHHRVTPVADVRGSVGRFVGGLGNQVVLWAEEPSPRSTDGSTFPAGSVVIANLAEFFIRVL